MADPFSALLKSLQSVFHLVAMRNGKYAYTPIQTLKEAVDGYDPSEKKTFIALFKALKNALPYLEKWRIDLDFVKSKMDELARSQNMPDIDWNKIIEHRTYSAGFQFSSLNHSRELTLVPWIATKLGKSFADLNHFEVTHVLVDFRDHHGFSQKLNAHLKEDPDFLAQLIMESERNFIKISHTRLSLYLTDTQIAEAILKHAPKLLSTHENPLVQIEQFIHTLNGILSNGRSVNTLLRNTEAKTILERSDLFQLYQSDQYKTRGDHAPKGPSA